jgi:hypothetical protein
MEILVGQPSPGDTFVPSVRDAGLTSETVNGIGECVCLELRTKYYM